MAGLGLFRLAPLVGLIVLAVYLVQSRRPARQAPRPAGTGALDILKIRCARGAVTAKQYEEMRRSLEGQSRPSAPQLEAPEHVRPAK